MLSYSGVIQGADGAFYGSTYAGGAFGKGTVYRFYPGGAAYSIIYNFSNTLQHLDGLNPQAAVTPGPSSLNEGERAMLWVDSFSRRAARGAGLHAECRRTARHLPDTPVGQRATVQTRRKPERPRPSACWACSTLKPLHRGVCPETLS
jgi:uncharacterized repeat protein (TIGR03803 family)